MPSQPIHKTPLTPREAEIRLQSLCARSEQCSYQLRQKLWKWRIAPDKAEAIMDRLIDRRFVDDTRFARSYINDKIRLSRWGQRKVAAALAAYRIPSSTVREILDSMPQEIIEENLLHILTVKAKTLTDPNTYEGRTALFRYAISRGYRSDTIRNVITTHFK